MARTEVRRVERLAARHGRQLLAVVDTSCESEYLCLGSVSREFEIITPEELTELRAAHGEDGLLVVTVEERATINPEKNRIKKLRQKLAQKRGINRTRS
jgi:hypothetical protein